MRHPLRRTTIGVVAALSCLAALLAVGAAPAAAAPVQIQILTLNDFHGRIEANGDVGGAAQIAGLIDEYAATLPTSVAAAGDNIGASPFVSAVDQDNPTIDVLTAMGLDVSTVGNHEFDKGIDDLLDRVIPRAGYTYLGANVYEEGTRVLPAYEIVEVGGVDVGYVGVVTQETPSLVSPDGIVGLEFTDPVAEAEAVAAELSDGDSANGEADVVVLLAHEGAGPAHISSADDLADDPVFGEFVAMSDDVDAIVSGHTHLPYAFMVPVPGTSRTRPVLSAEEYGRRVGRITLTVDPDTDVVSAGTADLIDVEGFTPDPDIAAMVQAAVDNSVVLGAEPVGSITADIVRGGTPPGADRGVESALGNLIADVQLAGTVAPGRGGAQIAFMNAGGMRADLLHAADPARPGDDEGVVTYSEAFEVQPFANDVVTMTLTGAQIQAVLEEQWQPAGASRPVLWLGVSEGFHYEYSPNAPQGHRIVEGSMTLDGVPLERDGTYRVTVNSFLAAGGDNYATLALGVDRVTTGDNDLTMLVDYLQANSPVTADTAPRSTAITPAAPDVEPFISVEAAVGQQLDDFAVGPVSDAERRLWEARIHFGTVTLDQMILEIHAIDLRSPEAQVTRLYLGLFGRPPGAGDLAYWTGRIEGGWTIARVAAFFAGSPEFRDRFGPAVSDETFVTYLYETVLGRAPGTPEVDYWVGQLGSGVSRGKVLLHFTEAPENRLRTAGQLRYLDIAHRMLERPATRAELAEHLARLGDTVDYSLIRAIEDIRTSDDYVARLV